MEREQTTIRLPPDLKEEVQRRADEMGVSLRDFIVMILWDYFSSSL